MKILFTFGGIPHYLNSLLTTLNSLPDVQIEVVIPNSNGKSIGKGVKLSSNEVSFNVTFLTEYKSTFGKLYFKNFLNTIKEIKPDILVIGWPYILPFSFDLKTLFYLKRNKIKLIYREIPFQVAPFNEAVSYYKKHPAYNEDLQITNPQSPFLFYFWAISLAGVRRWYYSLADATLSYAPTAYLIQQSYGVSLKKIFVAGNSPETNTLLSIKNDLENKITDLGYSPYRLIHVGRLVKWKRVDLLLKAVAILRTKFSGIEAIIIGDGPESDELKDLSKTLGISEHVEFISGTYNSTDLGKLFLSSSVYVLAGMGGLSINEAMAFGKPVICSVCDGTEKLLVRDGYNGYYFEEGDEKSLAEKIDLLLSDHKLIEKMGQHSEQIIRNEINLETVSAKYLEAFNFVLK